jgi:RNA polymerase sigma-70 factor (ECF subfamily)
LKHDAAEVTGPATPDDDMVRREQRAKVRAAIRGLPALYREPLVLKHVNGWSYRQIADAMDMPVETVETRLVRARRLLREVLQDQR